MVPILLPRLNLRGFYQNQWREVGKLGLEMSNDLTVLSVEEFGSYGDFVIASWPLVFQLLSFAKCSFKLLSAPFTVGVAGGAFSMIHARSPLVGKIAAGCWIFVLVRLGSAANLFCSLFRFQ